MRNKRSTYTNFIQFDHVIKKFRVQIIKIYIDKIDSCLLEINNILTWMTKTIPAKTIPNITPRFTKFVQGRFHYYEIFKYIYEWYNMGEPDFAINDHLMGLRNLSTIYEFVCLISIIESLQKSGFNLSYQEYHKHHFNIPFGGKKIDLPDATLNNVYILEKEDISIEVFYEPKIFRKSKYSNIGDIVNISSNLSKYKTHYYSPDFLLNIKDKSSEENYICILDAKYKNKNTVKMYDIDNLVKKYLLNIHQIGESNISSTPIKMVYALFAHENKGKEIRYYAQEHQLTGNYPVLPAIGGILLTPSNTELLDTILSRFLHQILYKDTQFSLKI